MKQSRFVAWCAAAILLVCITESSAGVVEITGSTQASVLQLENAAPIQTDLSQQILPTTKPELPIFAQSNLERLDTAGAATAAARASALLVAPNLTGIGGPNDAGLDLSAFADDTETAWRLESQVLETRVMNLSAVELGATDTLLPASRARSRVLLSGVMIIAAMDSTKNLSGSEVNLTLSVTQHRPNAQPITLLAGEVAIVGHENGLVSVDRADGVFSGRSLAVVDFLVDGGSVPLASALIFTGLELPYEYEVSAGETFRLEYLVRSQVITQPGGIGAAATFGIPQDALGVVFERVKKDNRGRELAELISQHVDTTGEAYVQDPPSFPFIGVCGAGSVEIPLLAAGMGMISVARGRRRLSRSGFPPTI